MELRINTKGVGGKLPNFGFVVFDDSDPVQKILGAKVDGACIDIFITHFHSIGGGLVTHISTIGQTLTLTHYKHHKLHTVITYTMIKKTKTKQ